MRVVSEAAPQREVAFLDCYERLVKYLRFRLGNRELAEDLAQETILKALESKDRFDPSQDPWPWVKTIAINTAIDHIRRTGREIVSESVGKEATQGFSAGSDQTFLVEEALKALPPRHRIALSLKYLNDWRSEEAAQFLGLSRTAFDQLLKRARSKMCVEYRRIETTLKGLGVWGLNRLRLRTRFPRAQRHASEATGTLSALAAENVSHLIAALALIVGSHVVAPAALTPEAKAAPHSLGVAEKTKGNRHGDHEGRNHTAVGISPAGHGESRTKDSAPSVVDDFTNPNKGVRQPEDAQITSIAMGGKSHPVAYAAGHIHCRRLACPPVLFQSRDGGQSWTRLPALGLTGTELAVPQDDPNKIFAMGPAGLEVSGDGGRTFRPAIVSGLPVVAGSIAISPLFSQGDPRVLIGSQALVEYTDSDGKVVPYPTALNGPFEPVFSPNYASDSLFLLGGVRQLAPDGLVSTVFICNQMGCNMRGLPARDQIPRIRPVAKGSDGLHTVYAFTEDEIYVNENGLSHFRALDTSWDGTIFDLEPVSGDALIAGVVAIGSARDHGLYLSTSRGNYWLRIESQVVADGAFDITVHEDMILVALPDSGVACSDDGGRTFTRRCRL